MEATDNSAVLFTPDLNQAHFEKISRILYATSKITMQTGKEELVKSRLVKRIRALGLSGFDEYIETVEKDAGELYQMVDLLTTNKTSFFRENAHFDFMKSRILPGIKSKGMRIWSAGCSSGEEPYTIAMVLNEALGSIALADTRILATDLSKRVLEKAVKGVYEEDTLKDVPVPLITKHFDCGDSKKPRQYSAKKSLRNLISFAPLNLMETWPMKGPFDIIFCRNVMIYFDKPTQEKLVNRFWGLLKPGGYLFSGHSESLAGMTHDFRYVQPAVHLKE